MFTRKNKTLEFLIGKKKNFPRADLKKKRIYQVGIRSRNLTMFVVNNWYIVIVFYNSGLHDMYVLCGNVVLW